MKNNPFCTKGKAPNITKQAPNIMERSQQIKAKEP